MEVIELSGYSEQEKLEIAKRYLVPKQCVENGISERQITFDDSSIRHIINHYTAENGVRELERKVGGVCRHVAYQYAISKDREKFSKRVVSKKMVKEALGSPTF